MLVESLLGWEIETADYRIIFGKKKLTVAEANNFFSKPAWGVNQIHSSKIQVDNQDFSETACADGMLTPFTQRPLLLKTADCLPCFVTAPGFAIAIHAGWKGLKKGILSSSLPVVLKENSISVKDCQVWIGPHIRPLNYIISKKLAYTLDPSLITINGHSLWPEKVHMDLAQLALIHLCGLGISASRIHILAQDTYLHPELYSFRENQTFCRNLSLIVRR